jgi:hypothetical protein
MRTYLVGISRFLAGICAVLFVLTAGIALVLFNAENRLFNASLYIKALDDQDFYDRLPALVAESIAASPTSNEPNNPRTYLNLLPADSWETIFRALIPPDVSRPLAGQAIQSIFEYLNGRSETASLSLVDFKTHLTGTAGTESLMVFLRSQPSCTIEQIAQITIGNLSSQSTTFIICNPSDELLNIFQPILQAQLQSIASTIPDSVDLTPNSNNTDNPLNGLRAVRALMRFSPIIPLGFLFLITILAVRELKNWLDWWGIPILFGGILGFLLSATIGPLFLWTYVLYITPHLPDFLPASVTDAIRGLISSVLSGVTAPILIQSAMLVLIGIVMILINHFKE